MSSSRPSGPYRRRKILIVEDHNETRVLYGEHFAYQGYYVETAETGNEAIASALRMEPDVIILDLAMPELDGWSTVDLLHTYLSTKAIPVIACTAVSDPAALARAEALGCSLVVRKPCRPSDIERAVDGLLAHPPITSAG